MLPNSSPNDSLVDLTSLPVNDSTVDPRIEQIVFGVSQAFSDDTPSDYDAIMVVQPEPPKSPVTCGQQCACRYPASSDSSSDSSDADNDEDVAAATSVDPNSDHPTPLEGPYLHLRNRISELVALTRLRLLTNTMSNWATFVHNIVHNAFIAHVPVARAGLVSLPKYFLILLLAIISMLVYYFMLNGTATTTSLDTLSQQTRCAYNVVHNTMAAYFTLGSPESSVYNNDATIARRCAGDSLYAAQMAQSAVQLLSDNAYYSSWTWLCYKYCWWAIVVYVVGRIIAAPIVNITLRDAIFQHEVLISTSELTVAQVLNDQGSLRMVNGVVQQPLPQLTDCVIWMELLSYLESRATVIAKVADVDALWFDACRWFERYSPATPSWARKRVFMLAFAVLTNAQDVTFSTGVVAPVFPK